MSKHGEHIQPFLVFLEEEMAPKSKRHSIGIHRQFCSLNYIFACGDKRTEESVQTITPQNHLKSSYFDFFF